MNKLEKLLKQLQEYDIEIKEEENLKRFTKIAIKGIGSLSIVKFRVLALVIAEFIRTDQNMKECEKVINEKFRK